MLLFISAVAVVLIVSFLCSIFESVLLSLTRPQVEVLVQKGKRAGHLLASFKERMDVPIAAILILNTAAHTVGASVAGASYQDVFDPGTLWIFSILFTLAVLLFTEIIPKTLGVTYAARLASPVAHGIRLLTILLKPLVVMSEGLSRSLRGDVKVPVTTAEEIRLLAMLGQNEGAVGSETANMVVGATQLRHLQAQDIVLPREEVQFLSAEMSRDEAINHVREYNHSRFPFSPSRDLKDVSGVVLAKDLYYWLLQNDDEKIDWSSLVQESLIVPPTVSLLQLLHTFQERQRHLAIIVDEYGTIEGIATMEDVLEEIVGEIFDESDLPREDLRVLEDGSTLVRASTDLRKLSSALGLAWDPDSEAATIGGLVTEELERIPAIGDEVSWQGFEVRVIRADKRRAKLLRIFGPEKTETN